MSNRPTVSAVKLDISVLLKILKHAKEANFKIATGQLHGIYRNESVEVSNCYPVPNDEDENAMDAFDNNMQSRLEEVGMDANKVGWYQISSANEFLNGNAVEITLGYQSIINYAVYLVYDILEAERGSRNPFKAFRINKQFFEQLSNRDRVNMALIRKLSYKADNIYEEVPVEIVKNPLTKAFLYEQRKAIKKSVKSSKSDLDLNQFFERTIQFLIDAVDDQTGSDAKIFQETDKNLKNLKKEEKESAFEMPVDTFIESYALRHKINNFSSKILNCGKLQLENAYLLGESVDKQQNKQ